MVVVLKVGLVLVVCVGEMLEQCEVGQINEIVGGQLDVVFVVLSVEEVVCIVVVYELVWVIGIGKIVMLEMVQEVYVMLCVCFGVKSVEVVVKVCVLYGGSMKLDNVG